MVTNEEKDRNILLSSHKSLKDWNGGLRLMSYWYRQMETDPSYGWSRTPCLYDLCTDLLAEEGYRESSIRRTSEWCDPYEYLSRFSPFPYLTMFLILWLVFLGWFRHEPKTGTEHMLNPDTHLDLIVTREVCLFFWIWKPPLLLRSTDM